MRGRGELVRGVVLTKPREFPPLDSALNIARNRVGRGRRDIT